MHATKPLDILIVEDSPIIQRLMVTVLARAGYSVEVCGRGDEAMALAVAQHPKLILLDVGLPDTDGFTLCRQLKALDATQDIPIIFVTGSDQAEDEAMSFEAGGADFIAKPVRPPVLLARVKAHILLQVQRRSLEGTFRDVIEYAPVMFLLADMAGKIVQTNAKAQRHLGYSFAELKGLPLSEIIPGCEPYLQVRAVDADEPADASAQLTEHVEIACRCKDGSAFPGEVTFSLLTQSKSPLHMVVLQNISVRVNTFKSLEESRQRIRELAAEHENTREDERKHIAREVHDELGQVLSAMRMDLSFLNLQFGKQLPELATKVAEMKRLADRAIDGVRHVVTVLRPEVLDWGLVPAIGWLRDEFFKHSGVRCTFSCNLEEVNMPEAKSRLIYRIVQESLTNITRYAQASEVDIQLIFSEAQCLLSVQDNGCGFDPQQLGPRRTYGLLGMRERSITLGGELVLDSVLGRGTLVSVRMPYNVSETLAAA
jgi:PAS domain S-box-containing protein